MATRKDLMTVGKTTRKFPREHVRRSPLIARYKAMSNRSVTSSPDQGMTLHRISATLG